MNCPACEQRQAQEQKQLSDCEGRCKEISLKNQRLSLALAVVATLAGKESLDFALGLSSTLGGISSASSESPLSKSSSIVSAPPGNSIELFNTSSSIGEIPGERNFLSDLPAISPSFYDSGYWDDYGSPPVFLGNSDSIFVPTSSVFLLAGLAFYPSRRRRK